VEVYQGVLLLDPANGYAHHYRAFNLDVQGLVASEVERGYRESLSCEPLVALWHMHWICFLITRGRTGDARAAWDGARDLLTSGDAPPGDDTYRRLHVPIVGLLLNRAQTEFARAVLETVPGRLRDVDPVLRALRRHLQALEASLRHPAVFPLTIDPADWWERGPHLCGWRFQDKPLVRWLAARVETVDAGGRTVSLFTATPPAAPGTPPVVGRMTVSWVDFDRTSENERAEELEPGRFVEMAVYGSGTDEALSCRVHPRRRVEDLPVLWPGPDRYLRQSSSNP
jgi:hypothetical protein